MNKKNKGFSLVEIALTLTILGLLMAITSPMISSMMPSKNKVMIKRSYFSLSNVIKNMIENPEFYNPYGAEGTNKETSIVYSGFDDTKSVTYNGKSYSGASKFRELFMVTIGANNTVDGTYKFKYSGSSINGSGVKGYTKDKISWTVVKTSKTGVAGYILVDVNGDKAPNCYEGSTSCKKRTKDFDQYSVRINNDGTIELSSKDVWVRNVLDSTTSSNNQ